jgi:ABC-type multidrug transport system permease subunit
MLRVLLVKDLRRAWRNPLPWVINLLMPLAMTALIGLAFGGRSDSGALGRIRFAVVDEDKTPLTEFLRGSANQREAGKYLEPVFLDRAAALKQITDDKLSAVLVIPEHFTRNYLTGSEPVRLELIKNPAQSIHPAVLEELLGAVVTGMNAMARNFRSEFPEVLTIVEGKGDYLKVAAMITRAGDKFQTLRQYLDPPLVSYEKEVKANEPKAGASKKGPTLNIFGYLLAGLSGMFLLFLASNGMTDLHRELRYRTFERYLTVRQELLPFVAGKVLFTVVLLLASSAVMLGGGSLIFRFHWQHPFILAILVLGYACFAATLMAVVVAAVTEERLANALTNMTGMALGIAGGCAFPPENLPAFLRDHIGPLLPSYWFSNTVRWLEGGGPNAPWVLASLKLVGVSVLLIFVAAVLFRRRFKTGVRA